MQPRRRSLGRQPRHFLCESLESRLVPGAAIIGSAPLQIALPAPAAAERAAQAGRQHLLWSGGFHSAQWMSGWHVRPQHQWGLPNLERINHSASGPIHSLLRVHYPQGSASPTVTRKHGAPVGGVQFVADLGIAPHDSLHLRYYVRFPEQFDFVKGGKLPGLFGGTVYDGRHVPNGTDGLSTRYMWRKDGEGEVYAYLATSVGQGTSLGQTGWKFQRGTWHVLEQEVVLNTPGTNDGRIRVWLDEKPVADEKGLVFRTVPSLKIEGIFFSTFFGGGDSSWATPKFTHVEFARFAVSESYIGR